MIRVEDPEQMTLYRNYYRAAQRGDMVAGYARLYEILDISEGSGALINADEKLIELGLIITLPFNRSRMIFVVELGKWTAPPSGSRTLFWRDRPEYAGRTRRRIPTLLSMEAGPQAERAWRELPGDISSRLPKCAIQGSEGMSEQARGVRHTHPYSCRLDSARAGSRVEEPGCE